MFTVIVKLALYVLLCYSFSRICLANCGFKRDDDSAPSYFLQELVFNTLVGICSQLLLGHLFALLVGSFIKATWISMILMLIPTLIFGFKHKTNLISKPDWFDWAALALAAVMAILSKMRYELFGDSARLHLALTGSIANNHNYPPIWPTTHDLSMSFYHYGLDLYMANIKLITGLTTLDTFPVHIAFSAIFGVAVSFVLMRFFIKTQITSFITAIFYLFLSLSCVDYFFSHMDQLGSLEFLQDWSAHRDFYGAGGLEQSRGAVSNWLTYSIIVLIITQLQKLLNNQKLNKFTLAAITLVSFMLYAVKSSLWVSVFCATAGAIFIIGLIKLIQRATIKDLIINALILLTALFIGKTLSFGADLAEGFHGIKPMIIQPSWNWVAQSIGTLPDYYSQEYLAKTLGSVPDLTHGVQRPTIPLFSAITFRKYGFYGLLALLILSYQLLKKKINWSSFMLLIAWISAPVPFLVAFVPKPFEILRLLSYLAIYSLLFVFINLALIVRDSSQRKLIAPILSIILAFFSIPCALSILPTGKFTKGGATNYWLPDAKVTAELERIHKTGDILVDSLYFHLGHHASELAGFYGVGGQMYKSDVRTRWTALQLMNPLLLEELEVDYVLVAPNTKVSERGRARLKNPKLFQEVQSIRAANPQYQLYKFVGAAWAATLPEPERKKLNEEYQWILGYTIGEIQFQAHNVNGNRYAATRKDALEQILEETRGKVLEKNRALAIYTVSQALPR